MSLELECKFVLAAMCTFTADHCILNIFVNRIANNCHLNFVCFSLISGWFTLLNQEGKECAMTLSSMGQVAAARVPAFLTKFDVPVYKLTDSNGKTIFYKNDYEAIICLFHHFVLHPHHMPRTMTGVCCSGNWQVL